MIPYSELVGLVTSVNFKAFDQRLFAILGQLSVDEHEAGRPLLSVLVVHKTGDMQPGDGFFELAQALGRNTSDIGQGVDRRGAEGVSTLECRKVESHIAPPGISAEQG